MLGQARCVKSYTKSPGGDSPSTSPVPEGQDGRVSTYLDQLLLHSLFNVVTEGQLGVSNGTVVASPFLESQAAVSLPQGLSPIDSRDLRDITPAFTGDCSAPVFTFMMILRDLLFKTSTSGF